MKTKKTLVIFTFLFALMNITLSQNQAPTVSPCPKGFVFIPSGILKNKNQEHKIKPFYMSKAEITNEQYNDFLADLKEKNNLADYEIAKINGSLWDSIDFSENYTKKYQTFDDYPVVNISIEAAQLFCRWLTDKYRKEGKIPEGSEFKLPNEAEWTWAAQGNLENCKFPWGNNPKDKQGNLLARYKALESVWGPAKTESFKPNNYGLFDMGGNVSEIISDRKIVKGGNWNSSLDDLTINSYQEYSISPIIGFRPIIYYFIEN